MKFNIIGTGSLGMNLALSLLQNKKNKLVAVCNQNLASSKKAVACLGYGDAILKIADLPAVDITFITVPDDALLVAVSQLYVNPRIAGRVIVHCSGVHSSQILHPLKEQGAYIASAHPFKAFPKEQAVQNALVACDCALEGDAQAITMLEPLFTKMGANTFNIKSDKKALYHVGAVFASNYLVTLANTSLNLLMDAGLTHDDAKALVLRIMQNNLDNIAHVKEIPGALTGPLMRNDIDTIQLHLEALADKPYLMGLYKAIGAATLAMTEHEGALLSKLE